MELRQYLLIARRWAWLLILGLVLGAADGYCATSRQTPVYRSSTKIMVSASSNQATTNSGGYYADQQLALTYIQLFTTQPIIAEVGEKLGYLVNADQISTQMVSNTSIIRLSVEDTDPQRAADISNMLVDALIAQNEKLQNSRFTSTEESLQAQLAQIHSQITTVQDQIANISEESLLAQQAEVKAEIDNLETQIIQVQREINELTTPTVSPEEKSLLQEKQLRL